jgi:hypothetical protein
LRHLEAVRHQRHVQGKIQDSFPNLTVSRSGSSD